jgi:hypothetical protein
MLLSAYSRDPNMLFSNLEANNNNNLKQQQNHYKNVTLKIDLSEDLPAQTHIFEAVVDWYHTTIKVFLDSDDALNNIIYFEGSFHIPCKPQLAEVYVSETFQFLSRGHSIHNPLCTCLLLLHTTTNHRYTELGIQGYGCGYDDICPLQNSGLRKSIDDIALELGISPDFGGEVQVSSKTQMPLFDVLTKLGGLDFTKPNFLSSTLCCVPLEIHSAQDILAAAKAMYPRPFLLDFGKQGTATSCLCETKSLIEDLEWLKKQSLVRVVPSLYPNSYSVFFCDLEREMYLGGSSTVDKYIKKLWHTHQEVGSSLFKGPSKMDISKLLLAQNIKPMNEVSSEYERPIAKKRLKSKSSASSMARIIKRMKCFQQKKK